EVDRLPGHHQHVVQRARRTDRLHAARRVPLLHAHQYGLPGHGSFRAGQEADESAAGRHRLAARVRTRLRRESIMTESTGARPGRSKFGLVTELWAFMRIRKK